MILYNCWLINTSQRDICCSPQNSALCALLCTNKRFYARGRFYAGCYAIDVPYVPLTWFKTFVTGPESFVCHVVGIDICMYTDKYIIEIYIVVDQRAIECHCYVWIFVTYSTPSLVGWIRRRRKLDVPVQIVPEFRTIK